jgi:phospholipase/carboxylesterase
VSTFSLSHLVIKSRKNLDTKPPLVLMLHGYGSNEQDLISLAPDLDARCVFISLRAPIALDYGGNAWFEIEFLENGIRVLSKANAEKSRRLISQFTDEAITRYGVNPKQIFLMGFSQGAGMSYATGLTEPEKFAGIIAMSGRFPREEEMIVRKTDAVKKMPVCVVHGLYDDVLPIDEGRLSETRLKELGIAPDYQEYPMAHQVSEESLRYVAKWLTHQLDAVKD